jgi:hypothetical protein
MAGEVVGVERKEPEPSRGSVSSAGQAKVNT